MYVETEASKFIEEGDFAVIKTGDDHAYYLLKLTSSPYETKCEAFFSTISLCCRGKLLGSVKRNP